MVFLLHQAEQTKREQMWLTPSFLPSFSLDSCLDVQRSENYILTMSYITRKSQSLTLNLDASTPYLQISCCDETKTLLWVHAVFKSITRTWLFCNCIDCSLPGSPVHGISQARILKWVAISISRSSFWPRDWNPVSCIGSWIPYHWAIWEAQFTVL